MKAIKKFFWNLYMELVRFTLSLVTLSGFLYGFYLIGLNYVNSTGVDAVNPLMWAAMLVVLTSVMLILMLLINFDYGGNNEATEK